MSKVRKTSIPVQSITEPSHTLLSYLKTVGSPLPFDENFADKSIEIFLGHQPYDHLRNLKLQQGNSIVVCLTQEELHSIWRSDLYGGADVAAISNWLIGIGQHRQAAILSQVINFPEVAEKTAFSIECCEGIQRINGSQLKTLCEIVNTLLESGCNVSMADFALDVVNKLFKEIGLPEIFKSVEQDVSGNIQLDFNPNALSEIPNGQISMLGNLAEAGKTMIHTLGSTRRPVLHPEVSPLVKVYSVATKAGRPKNEQLVCIDPLNGQWAPGHTPKDSFTLVGTPVIMIINDEHPVYKSKNWKGNVVLFAAHFSEIKSVDGISEDALSQMIGEVEGEEAVQEYKQKLSSADASAKSRLMQEFAYNCVQSAPQCKKKYTKTSSKW